MSLNKAMAGGGALAALGRVGVAVALGLVATPAVAQPGAVPGSGASDHRVGVEDYARAESFLPHNLRGTVQNAAVDPHWIGSGDQFWYRRQTPEGQAFVLVNSATGARAPAFDHRALARALSAAAGSEFSAMALPFATFEHDAGFSTIRFVVGDRAFACSLSATPSCTTAPQAPIRADLLVAPDNIHAVFVRDHNLWLLNLQSGAERALTTDGTAHDRYGESSDLNFRTLAARGRELPNPPDATYWSPDSTRLFTARVNDSEVADYPFLESVREDGSARPRVHNLRVALAGDAGVVRYEYDLIDLASGQMTKVIPPANFAPDEVQFSPDGRRLHAWGVTRGNVAVLTEIDAFTGAARNVREETNDTYIVLNNTIYSSSNVRVLPGRDEFIWFSERDGWGHLYLYQLSTGRLKGRITRGNWIVRDIVGVDEEAGRLLFTAGGRNAGEDPYDRHLYRIDFSGRNLLELTPEAADHEFGQPSPTPAARGQGGTGRVSPDGRYLVDVFSRVDVPPRSILRRGDGRVVATLETADVSRLVARGWTPPTPFRVKAADGRTDVYGLLYLPSNFDPSRRYRVIEHFYGGPQTTVVPHSYMGAAMSARYLKALAELGFAVVIMDGPGTPQRSKAFQDHNYPNFATFNIPDHIAAIRQLAAERPYLDISNGVGIVGHSFGGFGAARAILRYGDFYTVSAASGGAHSYHLLYGNPGQPPPVYSDGSHINPGGREEPLNWRDWDNSRFAADLTGRLMLAYGDLDENVYPATTLRLADALVRANKDFDLVYLANANHDFFRTSPYYVRRVWDHFVRHLLGQEPPAYRIAAFQFN